VEKSAAASRILFTPDWIKYENHSLPQLALAKVYIPLLLVKFIIARWSCRLLNIISTLGADFSFFVNLTILRTRF